ncbi:MAG: hypothetical protein JWM11_1560 [Planctomycetaceae bacterium]|nr:hypothetical protein [Planctomycetaceae bacterium]
MKTPKFNSEGDDKTTFAPVELSKHPEGAYIQFLVCDWGRIHGAFGDTVDDYYLNGYGIEGLVMACRLHAGLEPEADNMEYNSEGDACYICFENLDDAVETAQLVSQTLNDRKTLEAMISVARENGFEDS